MAKVSLSRKAILGLIVSEKKVFKKLEPPTNCFLPVKEILLNMLYYPFLIYYSS